MKSVDFFTKLGFKAGHAEELSKLISDQIASDIAFYVSLGYSPIQAEYLALNVFNTVNTVTAPAVLNIPKGFIGATKTRSVVSVQSVQETVFQAENEADTGPFGPLDDLFEADMDGLEFGGDTFESASAGSLDGIFNSPSAEASMKSLGMPTCPVDITNKIYERSGFKDVAIHPTSTIRTTVNTASFGGLKNTIMHHGIIDKESVRTEELINYLDYNFSKTLNTELFYYKDKTYMLVGLKGDKVENIKNNIVILLDTSGSMEPSASDMQKMIMTIVKQLKAGDKLSLVTYSSEDKVIFEGLDGSNVTDIILSLSKVGIGGCTCGSKGLERAYEIASDNFIEDGNNRIIIITDGDFNFGIIDQYDIAQFVKKKKETEVYMSVIGTSRGYIYQEQTMESISRNGNGNYFRIHDDFDIIESLKSKFLNNTIAVAKDVKLQVEFNPAKISQYKLIGYETRQLNHEDFKNDNVEAETLGNEQVTVALYELVMSNGSKNKKIESGLKYQKASVTGSEDICTVSVRMKDAHTSEVVELSEVVTDDTESTSNSTTALIGNYFADFIINDNMESYKQLNALAKELKNNAKIGLVLHLARLVKSTLR